MKAGFISGGFYAEHACLFRSVCGRFVVRLASLIGRTHRPYGTLVTSVHRPNGITTLTERYLDGSTKRVLENGVVKQSYAYGVNPDGTRWTLSASGPLPVFLSTNAPTQLRTNELNLDFPWQAQIADPLGRSVASCKPGFNHTVLVSSNAYDIANNLLSTTQYATSSNHVNHVILSRNLYSYDAAGNRVFTALDLNTNGVIDLSGPDRVTGSSTTYEYGGALGEANGGLGEGWWSVSRSWVYPEFNSSVAVTTSVQRTLLTGLGAPAPQLLAGNSSLLTSLSESIDIRGNATTSAAFIDRAAKTVTRLSLSPTSVHPSIQNTINGLLTSAVSSTAVTNTYAYDALGRQTAVTDGRGNTRATFYNALGQISATGDYLGDVPSLQLFAINYSLLTNLTSYGYDTLGRRTEVTDALGNVTHTRYDAEGRVIATWGATYPVAYAYDAQSRMVQMGTYRGATEITDYASFQSQVSSFDKTQWLYDNPTGLLTNKLYADGLGPVYTYTPDGKMASRLWARGILTSYTYDAAGSLLGVDYSDATPSIAYTYGRLGNMASVADASGTRTFVHSPDGQTLADAIQFQDEVFTLYEAYDAFGRGAGYALSNAVDGASSQIAGMMQAYDAFGRISEVSVADIPASFRYGWLPGSDLQQSLAMPNGVTRQTAYDPHRDVLASITHTNTAGTVLTRRTFAYDAAGRLTARTQYRLGDETNRPDAFGYNSRSELTSAALGTNDYAYAFDPIGNRQTTEEPDFSAAYTANPLNQYTNITSQSYSLQPDNFAPVFDLDGNQTLLKTTTGIWHVTYNAENRPVVFSNDTTVVEMSYDYQGRRVEYKEAVNNVVTRYERYLYRGYLQIAALDLLNTQPRLRHTLVWDPTEPVATRPLCLQAVNDQQQTNGYYYSFDQVKNVMELFDGSGEISATYNYAPFGAVVVLSGTAVKANPLVFSSEVNDDHLGLVYYNYRHLNVFDGRWFNYDPVRDQKDASYCYVKNCCINRSDLLGLLTVNIDELMETVCVMLTDYIKPCCTGKTGEHARPTFEGMLATCRSSGGKRASNYNVYILKGLCPNRKGQRRCGFHCESAFNPECVYGKGDYLCPDETGCNLSCVLLHEQSHRSSMPESVAYLIEGCAANCSEWIPDSEMHQVSNWCPCEN